MILDFITKKQIKYHTDKHQGVSSGSFIDAYFKDLNDAKEIFESEEIKADYDRQLKLSKQREAEKVATPANTGATTEPPKETFWSGLIKGAKEFGAEALRRNKKPLTEIGQNFIQQIILPKDNRVSEDEPPDSDKTERVDAPTERDVS